eukprot:355653-Chlamydomonas_euryale.AAC.2
MLTQSFPPTPFPPTPFPHTPFPPHPFPPHPFPLVAPRRVPGFAAGGDARLGAQGRRRGCPPPSHPPFLPPATLHTSLDAGGGSAVVPTRAFFLCSHASSLMWLCPAPRPRRRGWRRRSAPKCASLRSPTAAQWRLCPAAWRLTAGRSSWKR